MAERTIIVLLVDNIMQYSCVSIYVCMYLCCVQSILAIALFMYIVTIIYQDEIDTQNCLVFTPPPHKNDLTIGPICHLHSI